MAMPKREPTKVVRIPVAIAPLVIRIQELHKRNLLSSKSLENELKEYSVVKTTIS